MRWECRYSSCEMMYLEVTDTDVRGYLDHSPDHARHWTFEEVAEGILDKDYEVATLFTDVEIEEVKAIVRERNKNIR